MNDVLKTVGAVWKIGATRLLTAIVRVTHNVRIAEELAQEALVTALPLWRGRHPRKSRAWPMNLREQKLRAKRLKQI
jgi:RNA polymerase sigma-70 factor (ECF subfamily)